MNTNIIVKYFPDLNPSQIASFESLPKIYSEWNSKINVLSRKDIDSLMERHVLHSLSIARFIRFQQGAKVLDVGTGGGFPGIPLAIFFPETEFLLVDSIGKKIKVVEQVVNFLELKNVRFQQARAEEIQEKFDFVVSRAVAEFATLHNWVNNKFKREAVHAIPNGIICLKGGDLTEELKSFRKKVEIVELPDHFQEEFFSTKKLVYYPI